MQHLSIAPVPPLAEFIERFWYSSNAPAHLRMRVVPTGTIEMAFNLDDDELAFHPSEEPSVCNSFSGAIFSGAHAKPLFVNTRQHVMGVHFKPGGAFRFLGIPASELTGTHVDLDALWGKSTQELREQLCTAHTPKMRFRVLEQALIARLRNTVEAHRAVPRALEFFRRDAGETKTATLAAQLGLSQRHFIKVFTNQVGMTPKLFGRVQRFQRACQLTRKSSMPDWADIAAACGYFDQSHLIHDFQSFSGFSPTQFHHQFSKWLSMGPPSSSRSHLLKPSDFEHLLPDPASRESAYPSVSLPRQQ